MQRKKAAATSEQQKVKTPWNLIPAPSNNMFIVFDYEVTRYLLHNYSNTVKQTVTPSNAFIKSVFTGFWKCLSYTNSSLLFIILFPLLYWMSEHDMMTMLNYVNVPRGLSEVICSILQPKHIKLFFLAISVDFLLITSLKRRVKRRMPLVNQWFLHPKYANTQQQQIPRDIYCMPSGFASRAMIISTFVTIWSAYYMSAFDLSTTITTAVTVLLWSLFTSVASVCLGSNFISDVFVGWILGVAEVIIAFWIKETWQLFSH